VGHRDHQRLDGTARLVAAAGFPAVATASSGVADSLGYADGELTRS
jgi:2-methylisocitrate lyase-like PEP mutase family enzyme